MRRTGATPGQRFKGAGPLKSPGPSPAVVKSPQTGIQPTHWPVQHQQTMDLRRDGGLPAPTRGGATFREPQNPAQIGHAITRTARGNTKTAPPNVMRPTSGGKRPPTKSEAALIQQAQADNRLRAKRMRKGGQ